MSLETLIAHLQKYSLELFYVDNMWIARITTPQLIEVRATNCGGSILQLIGKLFQS